MASWDYGGLRANTCLFHQETWGHFFYTQPNKRQPPPPPTALLLLTPCNSFFAAATVSRAHARKGHTQMDAHTLPQTVRAVGVLGEEFNSERVALQVAGISCLGVNVRQKDKDGHFTGHWLLLPADQRAALALYRGGGAQGWWWDSVMQLLSCTREEMLSSGTLPHTPMLAGSG